MTNEDKEFLDRINKYAAKSLKDCDPKKTKISVKLDKLKPAMEKIAKEDHIAVEDVFIRYMDLASQVTSNACSLFQGTVGGMAQSEGLDDVEDFKL